MIAITGVNGFIGGRLFSFLKQMKSPIIGLSTSIRRNDVFVLRNGIPEASVRNIQGIIHCGGVVGDGFSKEEYQHSNVECTQNLVRWCEERQVKHFVLMSTGGVYGPSPDWVSEEVPLNPNGHYAESKLLAEEIVQKSHIPMKTILRIYFPIGNIYENHFFSRLVKRILTNETVYVNRDGGPRLSPIEIKDLAWLAYQVVTKHYEGIYNISANEAISMQQIISKIETYSKHQTNIETKEVYDENYLGNADRIIRKIEPYTFVTMSEAIENLIDSQKLRTK